MQAREQLQLQRLYAHSAGNVGGSGAGDPSAHPNVGPSPRVGPGGQNLPLGASTGVSGPRALLVTPPIGASGNRFSLGLPGSSPRTSGVSTPSTTTLSATAAPFVFGQTSALALAAAAAAAVAVTSVSVPALTQSTNPVTSTDSIDTDVAFPHIANPVPTITSSTDTDALSVPPTVKSDEDEVKAPISSDVDGSIIATSLQTLTVIPVSAPNASFDMGMTYQFERDLDTGVITPNISMTSGSAEEVHEGEGAVAMSRRFLSGLDEDLNFGSSSDNYPGFEDSFTPFDDESPSKVAVALGSLSLRSTSPENPVLGDSGWSVHGQGEEETFPTFPIPLVRPEPDVTLSVKAPLSIPAITPTPVLNLLPAPVPMIITPSIIIPQSTARFTGFTAMIVEDDPLSNPFASGGSSLSLPSTIPSTLLATSMVNSIVGNNNASMYNTQGVSSDERMLPSQSTSSPFVDPINSLPLKFTETFPTNTVKDVPPSPPASTSRIDWPFSKVNCIAASFSKSNRVTKRKAVEILYFTNHYFLPL